MATRRTGYKTPSFSLGLDLGFESELESAQDPNCHSLAVDSDHEDDQEEIGNRQPFKRLKRGLPTNPFYSSDDDDVQELSSPEDDTPELRGGDPFHNKEFHFLKPTVPASASASSIDFKLPASFSSIPSYFDPKNWHLKVEFRGWQYGQKDLKEWKAWVQQMASVHQSTWKKAGIYEAILNSTCQIRKNADVVYGLAEKWCSKTNTFIFPWGEATITLEDIMVLGGYSVLGNSIFTPLEGRDLKTKEDKLNEERKTTSVCNSGKARTSAWLKKYMNSKDELEHEAFLAYWLSRYVFHGDRIAQDVLSIAIRLARGTKVALAPAVLASIYRDLSRLRIAIAYSTQLKTRDDASVLYLKSRLQIVQLWAWERVLELMPEAKVVDNAASRLARWDGVNDLNAKQAKHLRRVLDSAGENFMWRPYAVSIENWSCPKYYVENEGWIDPGLDDEFLSFSICLRVTKLVGFDGREQYCPHRVARQFGFDQDIPCSIAESYKDSDILSGEEEIRNVELYFPSRFSRGHVSTRYMKWWKEIVSSLKNLSAEEASVPQKEKAKSIKESLPTDEHAGLHRKKIVGDSKAMITADSNTPTISNPKSSKNLALVSKGSNEKSNDSNTPPGFPPKSNRLEDGDHPMEKWTSRIEKQLSELTNMVKDLKKIDILKYRGKRKNIQTVKCSVKSAKPGRSEKEVRVSEALIGGSRAKANLKNVEKRNTRSDNLQKEVFEIKARLSRIESML